MQIDLNCDLGEGGGQDEALMALVSSVNIACGGHAGDDATMRTAVALACRHGVAVGAHPGFADRDTFGRRELALDSKEIIATVRMQVEALRRLTPLTHVKPHGGLYTLASRDRRVADAIASAVAAVDRTLVLVGLAGSELPRAGDACGLSVAHEGFADRRYERGGFLVSRSQPGAVIMDADEAVAQVMMMIQEKKVRALDGAIIPVAADTICLHGDLPEAVGFATRLRASLVEAGVAVRSLT